MSREWEIHIEIIYDQEKEIDAGRPIDTYVFDPATYERTYCKAIISKDPAKLPGADILRVRNFKGQLEPNPWAIKILETKEMEALEE